MVLLLRVLSAVTALLLLSGARAEAPTPSDVPTSAVPALSLPERRHPFLFADAATFAAAKERARRYAWARARLDRITTEAEALLASPLRIPEEGGQWSHYYICRQCAANLREKGGKHVCPKCGTEHTGWPYDQVAAGTVHSRNWHGAATLGLAWQLTGDARYAWRAREILIAYGRKYRSYPYHDYKGGTMKRGARVFAQTLDESVHGIQAAWAYDLVHDSPAMTDADRRLIEEGFLRGLVETIRRNDMGISNWQSWHNALLAAVGFCLGDGEIAGQALDGPSGLRFQLRKSVLPDGWWYEGAASYHFYALDALRWTTEAARGAGFDFYGDPDYKRLFDAPVGYMFPDMTFPAVNDSFVSPVSTHSPLYEIAWSRFRDPRYLPILNSGPRDSLEAFLWGEADLPATGALEQESRNFAGLGAAVLRQGRGEEALYVHLDYGPHGGAHGHPDKLAVIFFALGRQLAPDPGALKYSAPLHPQWYKTTFAHNALCVDGKSQKDAEGELTLFHSEPGFAVARARCDEAYPGVRMERTVVLTGRYLVDVVRADSDSTRTYDWVWHNEGEPAASFETKERAEPLGSSHGYQHMKEIRAGRTSAAWSADFRLKDQGGLRLTMAGGPETEVFFGTGMTDRPPRPCPMVVARREGRSVLFVSVLEPFRGKPVTGTGSVRLAQGGPDGELELTVEPDGGVRETLRFTPRAVRLARQEGAEGRETVFEAR